MKAVRDGVQKEPSLTHVHVDADAHVVSAEKVPHRFSAATTLDTAVFPDMALA